MKLAVCDLILLGLILLAVIRCVARGFITEVFSFVAVAGGLLLAFLFDRPLGIFLARFFGDARWTPIAAFLIIFILVYLVTKIFENTLTVILGKLHLDKLDRALGLFLGLGEGIILVLILVYLSNFITWKPVREFFESGRTAGFINDLFNWNPGEGTFSLDFFVSKIKGSYPIPGSVRGV
jgi:membrane protein required for colicin V production